MPMAPLRPCAGGCGAKVKAGRCSSCARATEQRRGSASARGYTSAWHRFCLWVQGQMVLLGILPVCGAILPGGPVTTDSQCKAAGLLTFRSADGSALHHDHEPPLTEAERRDASKVCDPMRLQLLCASCHAAKGDGTFRTDRGGVEVFQAIDR